MRLKKTLLVFLISTASLTYGQIKIGDNPQNINQGSVLELESTSRALVITRVSTAQMNAITPLQGAMVYNTNTQCIHYYNGSQWLNLCAALANSVNISLLDNGDGTYTFSDANNNLTQVNNLNESLVVEDGNLILTDSAGNAISVELQNLSAQTFTTNATAPREFPSILITTDTNGTNYNFEVGVIDGLSIQDGSIRQIDLAGASVGSVQLRDNSVTTIAIAENAVTTIKIANNSITNTKLDKSNIPLSGFAPPNAEVNLGNFKIINLAEPALDQDAATKNYVDQAITAGTADGSETILNNGTNINITGTGTSVSPYVINNTFTEVDGSVTNELSDLEFDPGTSILTLTNPATPSNSIDLSSLSGTGTDDQNLTSATLTGSILQINIEDGSPAIVDLGPLNVVDTDDQSLSLSGNVLNIDDGTGVDLTPILGGSGSTELADQITIVGDGTTGNEFGVADNSITPGKIESPNTPNQMLTTNGAGTVTWAPIASGSTELADGITIIGNGSTGNEFEVADGAINSTKITDGTIQAIDISIDAVTTSAILNANITPIKIEPGPNGQFLSTSGGVVIWDNLPGGTGGTVETDGVTLEGNGISPNPLQVRDGGITSTQILDMTIATVDIADNNITPAKIEQGANGEVLTTDGAGNVVWAAPTAGAVSSDGTTITGDGNLTDLSVPTGGITSTQLLDLTIATEDIADNNITPAKIEQGANGEVLTTDGAGNVVWAAPTAGAVSSDGTTITGDGNLTDLSVPTGGITSTQLLDLTIATEDIADNNITPAKIEQGANGEVLTTDGAGNVVWAAPTAGAVSSDGTTITGDGNLTDLSVPTGGITSTQLLDLTIATEDIADNNITPAKIEQGANGEVLTTDGAGNVVWAAPTAGAVSSDGTTITGDGNLTDLSVPTGGITSTQLLDLTIATEDIADNNITPAKIEQGANGEVLTTDGAGNVVWAAPTAGAVSSDGTTITGDGNLTDLSVPTGGITSTQILDLTIATLDIADNNITPAKIEQGANGEVLTTDGAGNVVWAAPTAGAVSSDGTTITGDGNLTDLSVPTGGITSTQIFDGTIATTDIADNAVTTIKILDNNVTPEKIAEGANGEVLTTIAGNAQWAAPTAGAVQTTAAIDGDGQAGTPLDLADNAVTSAKIADGQVQTADIADANVTEAKINPSATNGQVLTTIAGNAQWAAPTAGAVQTTAAIDGDGQAGTPLDLADNAVTSAKIADGQVQTADIADANVTEAKINPSATNGQVLTTIAGNAQWAAPTAGAVQTTAAIDGDGQAGTPLDLADNAVTSAKITDGQVLTADIADANVTEAKINPSTTNGQVLTTIAGNAQWAAPTAGAVQTTAAIDGDGQAGTPLDLADNAVTSAKIANGAIAAIDLNNMGAATNQILKWNGTAWAPSADEGGTFNLATDNLTQDAGEDRTYNLNSQNLSFIGSGLVGIGTGSPTNKLHVSGAIRAEGGFRSTFGTLPSSVAYSFDNDSDTGMYRPAANQLGLVTNELEAIRIDASQNVGIGLTGPLEKLHVDGNIRADGDFISNGTVLTVPDYVFQKYFLGNSILNENYNFQTLAQIEEFAKKYHHLPGIKSAAEVKKDGFWNLSQSNLQNLEKIEELFLYTIEQEKKIQDLKSENEALSKELKILKTDLEEIKALIKKTIRSN